MARARTTRGRSGRRVARREGTVADTGIPVDRRRRRVVEEEVPVRSVVVEEPVDVVVDEPDVIAREPWSPAQIVSMAVGAAFLLLGVVALIRAASGVGGFTEAEVTVAGFHHTGMLGLIEFFFGLSLMGIAAVPGGARPVMGFLGSLLVALGIVVAIGASGLHGALGVHGGHAVLYLVAGLTLIAASVAAPLFIPSTRRRLVEERVEEPPATRREVID